MSAVTVRDFVALTPSCFPLSFLLGLRAGLVTLVLKLSVLCLAGFVAVRLGGILVVL